MALLLPMLFFAIDFAEGIENFVGSAAGDGWSYVAYGQYLWEVRRGTPGPLAPLLQYATHLSGTRFISSALLGFFSPVTGMAGDTQGAVGVFLAATLFSLGNGVRGNGATTRIVWRLAAARNRDRCLFTLDSRRGPGSQLRQPDCALAIAGRRRPSG